MWSAFLAETSSKGYAGLRICSMVKLLAPAGAGGAKPKTNTAASRPEPKRSLERIVVPRCVAGRRDGRGFPVASGSPQRASRKKKSDAASEWRRSVAARFVVTRFIASGERPQTQ